VRRRLPRHLLAGLVWGALALAPFGLDDWQLGQLAQYLTYGILAMSLAFVWGRIGLLSFGHALFFGIGAYAMSLATLALLPLPPGFAPGWVGLALAAALPAAAANLLGRFLFYGRGLRGAYFAVVTLAIAVVAERLAANWRYIGGYNGLMNVPPLDLGLAGRPFEPPAYAAALAAAFLAWALLETVWQSRFGTVLAAIADDENRVGFFGHDTARCKLAGFTLAAAVAGLAGGLFVTQFGFASPTLLGFALSTEALIWTALGGKSLLLAAFLGAVATRWAESWLSETLGAWWPLALGLAFVAATLLLPRGLFGEPLARLERRLLRRTVS